MICEYPHFMEYPKDMWTHDIMDRFDVCFGLLKYVEIYLHDGSKEEIETWKPVYEGLRKRAVFVKLVVDKENPYLLRLSQVLDAIDNVEVEYSSLRHTEADAVLGGGGRRSAAVSGCCPLVAHGGGLAELGERRGAGA